MFDMSQNSGNEPNENVGRSGRRSNDSLENTRYEGFEGMNYEQRRPPYPTRSDDNNRKDVNSGSNKRRDEM